MTVDDSCVYCDDVDVPAAPYGIDMTSHLSVVSLHVSIGPGKFATPMGL